MTSRFLPRILPVLLAAMLIAGCSSKDDSTAPDIEAPKVTILTPAAGDTVGLTQVAIVVNATDDFGVAKVEFLLDGSVAGTLTASPWQKTLPIASIADGQHTVMVKAYDDAGNTGSASVSFVKGVRSVDLVQRMVLVELVTSANCIPCAPANAAYHAATDNDFYRARLATIKYHAWFPRSTDSLWLASKVWARPRIEYLFAPTPIANASAPNAWVDGAKVGSTASNWLTALDNDLKVAAEAKIDLSKSEAGGKIIVTAKVKQLLPVPSGDYRLHVVITEDDIEYNDGNAEKEHYNVMRQMLPSADGQQIALALEQTTTHDTELALESSWVRDNVSVVVFVQNNETKHVLQAAKISLK